MVGTAGPPCPARVRLHPDVAAALAARLPEAGTFLAWWGEMEAAWDGGRDGTIPARVAEAVRRLAPRLVVRCGVMVSERIGHLAGNTDLYACTAKGRGDGRPRLDILGPGDQICNAQLFAMWSRVLPISGLASAVWKACRDDPAMRDHLLPYGLQECWDRDLAAVTDAAPPQIAFTPQEELRGRRGLAAMGLAPDAPFVCLLSRDASYLKALRPDIDYSYHDYRDSDVDDFLPAARFLADRGLAVLRMGAAVARPLPGRFPGLIDYAARHRDDFMDVYLSAKCAFYFGDACGMAQLAGLFRRPLYIANGVPLGYLATWQSRISLIFKLYRRPPGAAFLPFAEVFRLGAHRFLRGEQYAAAGLDVVANSREDLLDFAGEALEHQRPGAAPADDAAAQRAFWTFYENGPTNAVIKARVGSRFLEKYAAILRAP